MGCRKFWRYFETGIWQKWNIHIFNYNNAFLVSSRVGGRVGKFYECFAVRERWNWRKRKADGRMEERRGISIEFPNQVRWLPASVQLRSLRVKIRGREGAAYVQERVLDVQQFRLSSSIMQLENRAGYSFLFHRRYSITSPSDKPPLFGIELPLSRQPPNEAGPSDTAREKFSIALVPKTVSGLLDVWR